MPVISEAHQQPTPHLIDSTSIFSGPPIHGYKLVVYFINIPKMPFLGWGKKINIVHSWKIAIDFYYGKAVQVTCTLGFNYSCQPSNDFQDKPGGSTSCGQMENLQQLQVLCSRLWPQFSWRQILPWLVFLWVHLRNEESIIKTKDLKSGMQDHKLT